jgi:hypothetical protein
MAIAVVRAVMIAVAVRRSVPILESLTRSQRAHVDDRHPGDLPRRQRRGPGELDWLREQADLDTDGLEGVDQSKRRLALGDARRKDHSIGPEVLNQSSDARADRGRSSPETAAPPRDDPAAVCSAECTLKLGLIGPDLARPVLIPPLKRVSESFPAMPKSTASWSP